NRSAARQWAPLARFVAAEDALGRRAMRKGPLAHFAYEFVRFGIKQAWACLFAAVMLALIISTYLWYPKGAALARYDFLVLGALALQASMLLFKLETWEEARVIFIFHAVGTVMEIFKTSVGSWTYPEPSLLRIGNVPLFTGFMYAAVGSYMTRCWRLFHFEFTRHPPLWALGLLSVAIYVNFFTHHYVWDVRPLLFAAAVVLFGPCTIHFKIWRRHRSMPLIVGLALVALFIWFAENIGTFTAAWVYPHQKAGWKPVPISKFGAWFLLMLLSYTMVAALNGIVSRKTSTPRRSTAAPSGASTEATS
ncbi:MAG TPA: DUF817 domain-containing protein, partial [Hyphomicrobiaceae bacterium]|nr:DUF817 domain-containing protein [Hyphomicrobiaceae bacterium]